ncbi:MAG: glycogen synthase GlgA [Bacillota bacterium]|nr:glycogen synthase GlgA [Bacillota bacterium]
MFDRNLKILLVSPEVVPFAKVGGLADVAGSLPKALATLGEGELGHDVRVALPRYQRIAGGRYRTDFPVPMGPRQETAIIRETNIEAKLGEVKREIPVYLVDNYHYFNREGIYAYGDDAERFAFFCKAVLEMLPRLGFQPDVIHCNDWQTGLIPLYLRTKYRHDPFYSRMAAVYTIHNLQYQGNFDRAILPLLGIGDELFHPEGVEFYGTVSFMKAGLQFADVLSTVSPTYAEEIKTPELGERMDGLLRKRADDLYGIVNGINYHEFNPQTDPRLWFNYDKDHPEGKRENKRALQQELRLPVRELPLLGVISRLVSQKGIDLLAPVLDDLMQLDVQMVLLGTGDPHYERLFQDFQRRYPDRIAVFIGFNGVLAQRIYAGSDLFLMPSRFEPCGLGQMISMRYGTIPVVRATGGLADTVRDYTDNPETGNGFVFRAYEPEALLDAVRRALEVYRRDQNEWLRLVRRVMEIDHSWAKSAAGYVELYQAALKKVRGLAEIAV